LYDQTTVFSQRGTFRLLQDHVLQEGPAFKRRLETSIDASSDEVTVRYTDDHKQGGRNPLEVGAPFVQNFVQTPPEVPKSPRKWCNGTELSR
jgi:hypothetical protein